MKHLKAYNESWSKFHYPVPDYIIHDVKDIFVELSDSRFTIGVRSVNTISGQQIEVRIERFEEGHANNSIWIEDFRWEDIEEEYLRMSDYLTSDGWQLIKIRISWREYDIYGNFETRYKSFNKFQCDEFLKGTTPGTKLTGIVFDYFKI